VTENPLDRICSPDTIRAALVHKEPFNPTLTFWSAV
jgi:hypothetical protein